MKPRGVTLVEVMMTVAILGACFGISRAGIQMFNNATQAKVDYEQQMGVETVLYRICQEIRDSHAIRSLGFQSIKLQTYDVRGGYDVNSNAFFDEDRLIFVEYEYIDNDPNWKNAYLRRRVYENDDVTVREEQKLLKGIISNPSLEFMISERTIFRPYPDSSTGFPPWDAWRYDAIEINLGIKTRNHKSATKWFKTIAMRRRTAA